ncbi:MAG: TetR family transcriptional regulator [Pseudomonadota bacterium]
MSDPVKPQPPERSEQRCRQILEAAAECFERRGFHNASMAEISKTAGMSVGHIYHYFENKEAIIRAMVEAQAQELVSRMEEFRRHPDVLAALVERVDEGMARNTARNRAALKIEVLAEAARSPGMLQTLCESDRLAMSTLKQTLIAAVPALAAEPALLDGRANLIAALFDGLAIRALVNPDFDRDGLLAALRLTIETLLREIPAGRRGAA